MSSIFICHSSTDAREAMGLALALEAKGRSCWIAPRDIPAGADYPHEIVTGIERAETFLILLSPAAVLSKHILRELELAVSAGKRVLPLRVGRVELNHSMTFLLAGVQWIEVSESELSGHPDRIAHRISEGKGTRLRLEKPRQRWLPALLFSTLALTCLLAVGLAKWPAADPDLATGQTDDVSGPVMPSPEPVKPVLTVIRALEAQDAPPTKGESAAQDLPSPPPPVAAELPAPSGKWVCEGKAAYLIEWDMTFSGDRRQLVVSGSKARVDGEKAQAGERITTLTLQGPLEGQKWSGNYSEKTKARVTRGRFVAEFSETFEEFTGKIFTPDGKASSAFTGKAVR